VIDDQRFRNALSSFASGVTVISLRGDDGRLRGITVSAFSSVSLSPPIVLACVARTSACAREFLPGVYFGISILAEDQAQIAQHFAKPSGNKFGDMPFRFGRAGIPLIDGACAQLECVVSRCVDGGDHTIVIGEVLAAESSDAVPLVYARRKFHRLYPDAPKAASVTAPAQFV
jgi:flavin reductase (DIM6/NTAB) family NADH-FMN oxidoreductase RutF